MHYGGDRTNDVRVISEHDVVLTTYGVLTAAYKSVRVFSLVICCAEQSFCSSFLSTSAPKFSGARLKILIFPF